MSARPSARHRSREVALQALYAADLSGSSSLGQASLAAVEAHFEMPGGARGFAEELVLGVSSRAAEIDAVVADHASNWRLDRMAAVDRNVLRLATWELSYSETPTAVVLDEAVELARRFGSDSSPSFVNGILDAIARKVRSDARPGRQRGSAATEGGAG